MTALLHACNVLYLVAYSVRDILWLRVITIVAICGMIPYYYFRLAAPYEAIAWNSLFALVNIYQLAMLIRERRPVYLGDEELSLYNKVFRTLQPREFAKLLTIAEWKRAQAGEELMQQNRPVKSLMIISSGGGDVQIDGRHVAKLLPGQFVGEMGFLTEEIASARVVIGVPTDYLCWSVEKLRGMLSQTPALHIKFQGILGNDVVGKLRHRSYMTAHPSQVFTALGDISAL